MMAVDSGDKVIVSQPHHKPLIVPIRFTPTVSIHLSNIFPHFVNKSHDFAYILPHFMISYRFYTISVLYHHPSLAFATAIVACFLYRTVYTY